jgi:hypothetical protein
MTIVTTTRRIRIRKTIVDVFVVSENSPYALMSLFLIR